MLTPIVLVEKKDNALGEISQSLFGKKSVTLGGLFQKTPSLEAIFFAAATFPPTKWLAFDTTNRGFRRQNSHPSERVLGVPNLICHAENFTEKKMKIFTKRDHLNKWSSK